MEFGLLGELVVRTESGAIVSIGGARQRALLSLLLLNPNRTVPTDVLVDELWAGRPTDSAAHALKVAVSRLRQSMLKGDHAVAERILTREHGYLLKVEPGELDSAEFEHELGVGRAALTQGDRPLALAHLRKALARWRGSALDEFRDQGWARLDAIRLEGLRVEAIEERIGIELSLGRHAAVVTELESLVTQHPEREQLQAHLLLALYRSGRQVDALTAYRTARRHLIEEYGVEPGQELRDLHDAILAQDGALAGGDGHDGARVPPPPAVRAGVRSRALTTRLRVQSPFTFVGRDDEYAVIDRALSEDDQQARAVLVAGEPGIGKTRLVSEIATRAHERGMTVVGGRCDADLGLPYQPFVEALDDLLERASSSAIEQHLSRHGSVLARIIPRLSLGELDGHEDRQRDGDGAHYRLFAAVADLLTQLAGETPLLLVLEDLHWADEATVLLLKHLLTMPNREALTVIGTYRSTDVDGQPLGVLLPELHREQGVVRITLDGLAEPAVMALVSAHAGRPLGDADRRAARRLRRDTAGNPFFVVQLLQSGGTDAPEERGVTHAAGNDHALPVGLRETITARVARLGNDATAILVAAAVVGDEFDFALLRDLTDLGENELVAGIDAAMGAQLLLDADGSGTRLAFVHALVPHVLRSELSAVRRRVLHRGVAHAMERLYGPDGGDQIAALAHHWRQGCEPPDVGRAVHTARLAGDRALDRLAPAEAARWYEDALELHGRRLAPDSSERCELLIALGQAQREAGQARFRETLLDAGRLALENGDSARLVRATLANTRGFTSASGEIDADRVEMLKAAIASTPREDSPERARLLAAHAVELAFCGESSEPLALSDEALAMARRCDDDAALAQVLRMRFFAIWVPETLSIRLAESAENVRVCETLGDPLAQSQALHWRANACLEHGDMAAARHCIERVSELSGRLREPTVTWQSAYNDANLALALGRLGEADQRALQALELGQASAQPDAVPVFAAQLANLRFEQGRLGELIPLIEQTLAEHAGITGFRAVLALAHCDEEQFDQARSAMAYDAGHAFASLAYDVTWLSVMCLYAHVCGRLEDAQSARRVYDLLLPWRDQVAVSVVAWGCVAHYLGMLALAFGDLATAADHLAYGLQVHEQMTAPIWCMRTRLETARLCAARDEPGDGQRVRTLAESVLEQARQLGCRTIARDAAALISGRLARA